MVAVRVVGAVRRFDAATTTVDVAVVPPLAGATP
jgi:hypothetical protein